MAGAGEPRNPAAIASDRSWPLETGNKAKIAERLAKKLLGTFGWQRAGAMNTNWNCVDPAHDSTNHTTDAVYYYDDPAVDERVYFNTDLKSYGRATISKPTVAGAISSLLRVVSCAAASAEWKARYVDTDTRFRVHGMLFVYNHDKEWDRDFSSLVRSVDEKNFLTGYENVSYVLGPQQIRWIDAVANDINTSRGSKELPPAEECQFVYPQGVRLRYRDSHLSAASIEMLLGPWIILRSLVDSVECYWVYYRHDGSSPDQFKFLLDFLLRASILRGRNRVVIRQPFGAPNAQANLDIAKQAYVRCFPPLEELQDRLAKVKLEPVQVLSSNFSEEQIGME